MSVLQVAGELDLCRANNELSYRRFTSNDNSNGCELAQLVHYSTPEKTSDMEHTWQLVKERREICFVGGEAVLRLPSGIVGVCFRQVETKEHARRGNAGECWVVNYLSHRPSIYPIFLVVRGNYLEGIVAVPRMQTPKKESSGGSCGVCGEKSWFIPCSGRPG
jgi:hypothetical protein